MLSSILQLSSLEHLLVEQQHSNQFDSDQKRQPPSIRVDLKGQGEDAEGNKKDDLLSLGEFVQQVGPHPPTQQTGEMFKPFDVVPGVWSS